MDHWLEEDRFRKADREYREQVRVHASHGTPCTCPVTGAPRRREHGVGSTTSAAGCRKSRLRFRCSRVSLHLWVVSKLPCTSTRNISSHRGLLMKMAALAMQRPRVALAIARREPDHCVNAGDAPGI